MRASTIAKIGEKFNLLTVRGILRRQNKSKAYAYCLCDCGKTTISAASNVFSGNTKSCGCLMDNTIKAVDRIGEKYGRLTVLGIHSDGKSSIAECECECGVKKDIYVRQISSGKTKSCGCLAREVASITARTHGKSQTREHQTWMRMKQRCSNKNNGRYARYGGRGIAVCDRWLNSFEDFYADMGDRPKGMSIDRINNDGNYEPSNCKWSTPREQRMNQGLRSDNKTGTEGVHYRKTRNTYNVVIDRKAYGSYKTVEEAIEVANKIREKESPKC